MAQRRSSGGFGGSAGRLSGGVSWVGGVEGFEARTWGPFRGQTQAVVYDPGNQSSLLVTLQGSVLQKSAAYFV